MGYNNLNTEELLDLSKENIRLEAILEANDKNKQKKAVYVNQLSIYISQIAELLNKNEEFAGLIDLDKLKDKDYVNELLSKITYQLEQDKREFDILATKAEEVLGL